MRIGNQSRNGGEIQPNLEATLSNHEETFYISRRGRDNK